MMDLDNEELDATKNGDIQKAIDYFENMKEKLGCIMNDEFNSNMDIAIKSLKEKLNNVTTISVNLSKTNLNYKELKDATGDHIPRID